MISVEEALERILSYVAVLEEDEKPVLEALGQITARDIIATFPVPSLDIAAMDGYAVRAEDTREASPSSPRFLRLVGEVAAGALPEREVQPGTAYRIMTGAPVPLGADAVVKFEDTDELERSRPLVEIGIRQGVPPGLNIRRAGEDVKKGELVLERGRLLRPAEIGLLASLGLERVRVIRRPRVAILATGNELVPLGQPLSPGKIYNSNSYSLAALVSRYGGIPLLLGIARDDFKSVAEKLEEGKDADLILTSAGVSTGDYDVVKEVLAKRGEINFWTVCMKPGKPLAFGLLHLGGRKVPHLGLPGYPVSSMVTFLQFARPALLKMLGRQIWALPSVEAIAEDSLDNRGGRRTYARALVSRRDGQYYARLSGPQGSGVLTSMVRANALLVVPEDTKLVRVGDRVQVQMLDWEE